MFIVCVLCRVRSGVCIKTFQTASIYHPQSISCALYCVFKTKFCLLIKKNNEKSEILFILLSSLNHDNKENQIFHFLLFILKFFLSIKKETKMRKVILFLLSELGVEFEHFKYYFYALAK